MRLLIGQIPSKIETKITSLKNYYSKSLLKPAPIALSQPWTTSSPTHRLSQTDSPSTPKPYSYEVSTTKHKSQ